MSLLHISAVTLLCALAVNCQVNGNTVQGSGNSQNNSVKNANTSIQETDTNVNFKKQSRSKIEHSEDFEDQKYIGSAYISTTIVALTVQDIFTGQNSHSRDFSTNINQITESPEVTVKKELVNGKRKPPSQQRKTSRIRRLKSNGNGVNKTLISQENNKTQTSASVSEPMNAVVTTTNMPYNNTAQEPTSVSEPMNAVVTTTNMPSPKEKEPPQKEEAVVKETPRMEEVVVKESSRKEEVVVKEPSRKKVVVKEPSRKEEAVVNSDTFFDLFEEQTTAAPPVLVPPPDFNPNAPAKKKVIPKVDTHNSQAYDGTPCNETYKSHPTIKTKYMMRYAEGIWETFDCPPDLGSGLVWRQDLCSCGEELIATDPDDWCGQLGYSPHSVNKHKYTRRHHGAEVTLDCAATLVWSQQKCLCIFDPAVVDRPIEQKVTFVCKTILELRFEGDTSNTIPGYQVQLVDLGRRSNIPRIRFQTIPGSTDKAGMFVSQPLEFLSFRGNDFQQQVTYSISFKISPRHEDKDKFMVLLTDECIANPSGQNRGRKPNIALSFQPNTKTFHLQFTTESTEIDTKIKKAQPDQYGWYKIVLYFENKSVNLENNGIKLFSQSDVTGKIPQNKCPLYIAGRGAGFDRSQDFYGYLDNVFLVKDCKFHEANIKFL